MKWTAALVFVPLLAAQQFKFNLEHLESKASNVVDVSLNSSMLQFASRFLSSNKPDEAKAKKMVSGLEGIYVKSFEFNQDGAWSPADLESLRQQLKAPEWSRIVGFKSVQDGENAEVYVRNSGAKVTGLAVLVTSPREFTVVNIAGPVDLDSLGDLGGQFGLPKLKAVPGTPQPPAKDKKFE